jgi:hypothetical protein
MNSAMVARGSDDYVVIVHGQEVSSFDTAPPRSFARFVEFQDIVINTKTCVIEA